MADHTAGSPVSQEIRWTNRSPREIADELRTDGISLCAKTVRRILREDLHLGIRQALKDEPTRSFPQRNEQFEYIADRREWYVSRQWPVISIDTKKKEPLGNFFRSGRAFTDGELRVLDHDFVDERVVPYGVYDVARNEGLILLAMGADHSAGPYFGAHCRLVASNVHEVIITDCGHWMVQEQTAQVQKGLMDFFLK